MMIIITYKTILERLFRSPLKAVTTWQWSMARKYLLVEVFWGNLRIPNDFDHLWCIHFIQGGLLIDKNTVKVLIDNIRRHFSDYICLFCSTAPRSPRAHVDVTFQLINMHEHEFSPSLVFPACYSLTPYHHVRV